MNVLFLDFDGVLNRAYGSMSPCLDFDLVEELNRVLVVTGCCVVLSTSWRLHHSLAELSQTLSMSGFRYCGRIFGKTPSLPSGDRSHEIEAWMDAHFHDVHRAVVLDCAFVAPLCGPVEIVQTSRFEGLTREKGDEVIGAFSCA
jgi:hypothetical protein